MLSGSADENYPNLAVEVIGVNRRSSAANA
jgi:hypothetical protein